MSLPAPSVRAHRVDVVDFAELLALLVYLLRQLPRGRQDEPDRPVPSLQRLLIHDVHEQRPQIRRSLTAAGTRDTDHVSSV